MKLKSVIFCIALICLIGVIAKSALNFCSHQSKKAKAVDQAVWIARMWEDHLSLDQIAVETRKRGGPVISISQWSKGSGNTLVLGPVINDRQISVDRNLSVRWIPVKTLSSLPHTPP